MSYKPAKWPTYALEGLEDALSLLGDAERQTGLAQGFTKEGNKLDAVIAMSEIRTKLMKAHSTLIQAKAGEYKRQDYAKQS